MEHMKKTGSAGRNQTFQFLTVIGILSVIMGHVDLDTFPLMNTWHFLYSFQAISIKNAITPLCAVRDNTHGKK